MLSWTSQRGKGENSHYLGSSPFRLFLTPKEGGETSVCEVQVKGKAETPIQQLPARGCERWCGLGNNFL